MIALLYKLFATNFANCVLHIHFMLEVQSSCNTSSGQCKHCKFCFYFRYGNLHYFFFLTDQYGIALIFHIFWKIRWSTWWYCHIYIFLFQLPSAFSIFFSHPFYFILFYFLHLFLWYEDLLLILIFFTSSSQLCFCLFLFYFYTFWPLRHSSPCRSIPSPTPFSCCIYFIVFWERGFFLKGDL